MSNKKRDLTFAETLAMANCIRAQLEDFALYKKHLKSIPKTRARESKIKEITEQSKLLRSALRKGGFKCSK